ncbi:MAG: FHA domain-containing protein [Anaerolineae bacterium]|nr:FHA domain-containing protein [Anaerolineae bacterium]
MLTDVKVQGTARFEESTSLRLEIEGSPEPILFQPKPETIFGRRDPATGAMPDIDLTPFAGYRMGVSRRHAAIRHGEEQTLDIWDLGSSNGTFLNGQRLSAHRPYRLHDGDELRLGQMVIKIYFRPSEKPAVAPKPAEAAPAEAKSPDEKAEKPAAPVEAPEAKPPAAEPKPAEAPKAAPVEEKPIETPAAEQTTEDKKAEAPSIPTPAAAEDKKPGEPAAPATPEKAKVPPAAPPGPANETITVQDAIERTRPSKPTGPLPPLQDKKPEQKKADTSPQPPEDDQKRD